MKRIVVGVSSVILALGVFGLSQLWNAGADAQGRLQTPAVDLPLADTFMVPPADVQTTAIVQSAQAFLDTLDTAQRATAIYDFGDNTQRANWSNFPDGAVQRGGVMLGDMTTPQRAALDRLLSDVMSEDGVQNILYQLIGEDALGGGRGGGPRFGSEYYYTSFLGEPSTTQPWMFQFGGHHLAINVTVFGSDLSFSPMLTGGEPLNIDVDGTSVYVVEKEVTAAQTFLASLTQSQQNEAIRGRKAINLLLGPGAFGTVIAPEGIKGSDLDDSQKALLMDVISARIGFINADDYAAKMAVVQAGLDETYFGWWGPQDAIGTAYFRIIGPSLAIEFAPQDIDGDAADHAHNMFREPDNDYGSAWIGVAQ